MIETKKMIELEDVTTLVTETLILRRVEDEILTTAEGEMG
jgi:hypothetical protein